jgi:hypothetical protein
MKTGKTLVELAHEIQRRSDAKQDFVVPTKALSLAPTAATLHFGNKVVGVKELAHAQMAAHLGIPKPYYDRMLADKPALLADNVNEWLHSSTESRMLRTLDGDARAYLSDRYRPLENEDLAEAVLPVLMDLDVVIMSADITDRRFYIKAVDRRIEKDIPAGAKMGDGSHTIFHTLSPAITISNSEVGLGTLSVQTSILTKQCTNLATFADRSIRKSHVGGKHEITDGLYHMLSDETRRQTDKAIWMQVKDVVRNAFDEARFMALTDQVYAATEDKIDNDPVKVVEVTARKFSMNDGERQSVLKHLIQGGDLSRYGLFNAVTRAAEDLKDYDRATEFERYGGQIVELGKTDWRELAEAA